MNSDQIAIIYISGYFLFSIMCVCTVVNQKAIRIRNSTIVPHVDVVVNPMRVDKIATLI
jgi:hypothetical protein